MRPTDTEQKNKYTPRFPLPEPVRTLIAAAHAAKNRRGARVARRQPCTDILRAARFAPRTDTHAATSRPAGRAPLAAAVHPLQYRPPPSRAHVVPRSHPRRHARHAAPPTSPSPPTPLAPPP